MKLSIHKYQFLLLGFLLIVASSCTPSYSDRIEKGNDYHFEPGYPAFNIITTSRVDEGNNTNVVLHISINKNSLIYKNVRNALRSEGEVIIEINREGNSLQKKIVLPLDFTVTETTDYYSQERHLIEEVVDVEPGEYKINVTVVDRNSNKQFTASNSLVVPNPDSDNTFHSNILMYTKSLNDSIFTAVNTYDIQEDYDSLKFEYQVTHTQEEPFQVQTDLIKIRADSSIPRRLSDRNYRSTSLEYKGVDYSKYDLVQSIQRTIYSAGSVTMEFKFGNLSKGNYRFESVSQTANGRKTYRARDFSIKSENYPSLKNAHEIAQPLSYLMTEGEYEELLNIKSPDSLLLAVERFWLKNTNSTSIANVILQLYYERVEQANRQFSNFKEGWKTDPGMVFILFGPPLYVEQGFGEMTWYYSFDSGSREPHIKFKDTQYGNITFPFEHYILDRSSDLFNLEYQQVKAWNDGALQYLLQK